MADNFNERAKMRINNEETKTGEVSYVGVTPGGFYQYEIAFQYGKKMFYCNPDDANFYNHCIKHALEFDKDPVNRQKRLNATIEQIKTKDFMGIEDAIRPKTNHDALTQRLNNKLKELSQ